ncbi:MAG: hypothetical protein AAGD28_29405 [Bacteroidota bacterium]
MLKYLILIISLITSCNLMGQRGPLLKKKLKKKFSWENSTTSQLDSFYLHLPKPEGTSFQAYLRIKLPGQTVDLFSGDGEHFQGILTNEICAYKAVKTKWGKQTKEKKVFSQQESLDPISCTRIAKEILASGQISFPTDSLIANWESGMLHCGTAVFQLNLNSGFIEQSYFCPWSQDDTVKFAATITSNIRLLENELELPTRYNEFTTQLPKGGIYSRNGYRMKYVRTKRQQAKWERKKAKTN